jgi:four helix bundle suffix protein
MNRPLTPNTQAILLLTAPLIAGRGEDSTDLLTLGDYNRLARILREQQKQPADLIAPDAGETVSACATMFGRERLESLLGRGFLLSQAVDRWNTRAIWVVSRADATYPPRLKARLKEDAPPEVAANTMLCQVHQTNYLLDQQLRQLEQAFLNEGGFTERLYKARQQTRRPNPSCKTNNPPARPGDRTPKSRTQP